MHSQHFKTNSSKLLEWSAVAL